MSKNRIMCDRETRRRLLEAAIPVNKIYWTPLIRFLIWLLSTPGPRPSPPHLRRLFISWFLAKPQYTIGQPSFRGKVAEDYIRHYAKRFSQKNGSVAAIA